jgi:hypothetical protein
MLVGWVRTGHERSALLLKARGGDVGGGDLVDVDVVGLRSLTSCASGGDHSFKVKVDVRVGGHGEADKGDE